MPEKALKEQSQAGPVAQALESVDLAPGADGQKAAALKAAADLMVARLTAGPEKMVPQYDAAERAHREGEEAKTEKRITAERGARPHRFKRLLDAPVNEQQRRFARAVPEVTRYLNQLLAKHHSKLLLSEAEVATNFLTEGGFNLLTDGADADHVDGFGDAGIDTLVDRYQSLKQWLHPSVREAVESGDHTATSTNEQEKEVHSITDISMETAMYANAGMYVAEMQSVARDLAAMGVSLASLPKEAQVFWTTIYFNAGEGSGRNLLRKHGVNYYLQKWTGEDSVSHNRNPSYNAASRTATFQALNAGNSAAAVSLPFAPIQQHPVAQRELLKRERTMRAEEVIPCLRGDAAVPHSIREYYRLVTDLIASSIDDPETNAKLIFFKGHAERLAQYQAELKELVLDPDFKRLYPHRPPPNLPALTHKQVVAELMKLEKGHKKDFAVDDFRLILDVSWPTAQASDLVLPTAE